LILVAFVFVTRTSGTEPKKVPTPVPATA
jgi:hypothetical protein